MKSMNIPPISDEYNFDLPDKLLVFGDKNGIKTWGHTLVWQSQLFEFFSQIRFVKRRDSFKVY